MVECGPLDAALEAVVETLETRVQRWPWQLCGELLDETREDVDGLLAGLLVVVEVYMDNAVVGNGGLAAEVVDEARTARVGQRCVGGGTGGDAYLRKVLPAPAVWGGVQYIYT